MIDYVDIYENLSISIKIVKSYVIRELNKKTLENWDYLRHRRRLKHYDKSPFIIIIRTDEIG